MQALATRFDTYITGADEKPQLVRDSHGEVFGSLKLDQESKTVTVAYPASFNCADETTYRISNDETPAIIDSKVCNKDDEQVSVF